MTVYKLPLVLDPQPEGGFTVTSPALPELITEGDTVDEALTNARDALAALIEAFQDIGQPLPAALRAYDDSTPLAIDMALAVP